MNRWVLVQIMGFALNALIYHTEPNKVSFVAMILSMIFAVIFWRDAT